jgi:hypothetical protein
MSPWKPAVEWRETLKQIRQKVTRQDCGFETMIQRSNVVVIRRPESVINRGWHGDIKEPNIHMP